MQYAVGHTINDYLELAPEVRMHTPVQCLLNRRWPRSRQLFNDPLHYWEIYHRMTEQLTFTLSPQIQDVPMALYERWETQLTQEESLSIIFQAVWQRRDPHSGSERITVQKWLVEENDWLAEAFMHLTTVFWYHAFGTLPDEVEVFALLEGRRMVFAKEELDVRQSLDYVRLLADAFVTSKVSAAPGQLADSGVRFRAPAAAEFLN